MDCPLSMVILSHKTDLTKPAKAHIYCSTFIFDWKWNEKKAFHDLRNFEKLLLLCSHQR